MYKIIIILAAILCPLICAAQEIDGDQLKDATVTADKLATDVTDDIADGVTAYSWGNHADEGYLTSLLHSHSNYITSLEHAHSGYATTEHGHSNYLTSLDHAHSNYLTSLIHNHDSNYEVSGAVTTHESTYDHTLIASAIQADDNVSELTNDAGYLTSLLHSHSEYLTSLAHSHSGYSTTEHAHDANYVNVAGDTITGDVQLNAKLAIGTTATAANQVLTATGDYTAAADAITFYPYDLRYTTTMGNKSSGTIRQMYVKHSASGKTDTTNAGIYEALYAQTELTENNAAGVRGLDFSVRNSSAGTAATAHGVIGVINNAGTGTITNAFAGYLYNANTGSGSITNAYNLYLAPSIISAGSIANQFGLYIDEMSGATGVNYSIYTGTAPSYFGGSITTAGNLNLPTTSATAGIININAVRYLHAYGTANTYLGESSGNFSLTGADNVAVGQHTAAALTDGKENVAVGTLALNKLTGGDYNVGVGHEALSTVTIGNSNTAIGWQALRAQTNSSYNVALGAGAGYAVTSGGSNVLIGHQPGYYISTGGNNTAIGRQALLAVVGAPLTGSYNVAVGNYALKNSQGAANTNTAVGYESGYSATTATGNLFLGYNAGYNETGSNKLYIENSNSATPLIGGDFSTDTVTINGALSATGNATLGDASSDLTIVNGSLGVGVSPSVKFQVSESSTANAYTAYISRAFSATSSTSAGMRTLSNVNTPGSTTSAVYAGIFNTLETLATDTGDHSSGYLSAQLNEVNIRGSGDIATTRGLQNTIYVVPTATGAWGSINGLYNNISISSTDAAGSSIGSVYGSRTLITVGAVPTTLMVGSAITAPTTTTTTVGTYYGYYSEAPATTTTNSYAFCSTSAGANVTNDWGVYALNDKNYFSGQVGIGTTAPTQELHVTGDILASATITAGQVVIDGGTTVTVDTAWNEVGAAGKPSFENSWVNSDSSTQATAAYRIDALGYVHLKGLVKDGTVGDYAIFTLPAGYRPEKISRFATTSFGAFGEVSVRTTGMVRLLVGNNAYSSLDGITFKAYQ